MQARSSHIGAENAPTPTQGSRTADAVDGSHGNSSVFALASMVQMSMTHTAFSWHGHCIIPSLDLLSLEDNTQVGMHGR